MNDQRAEKEPTTMREQSAGTAMPALVAQRNWTVCGRTNPGARLRRLWQMKQLTIVVFLAVGFLVSRPAVPWMASGKYGPAPSASASDEFDAARGVDFSREPTGKGAEWCEAALCAEMLPFADMGERSGILILGTSLLVVFSMIRRRLR
jgi:hypothetical protein